MNPHEKEEKVQYNNNSESISQNSKGHYLYHYIFDIKYEILSPIIRDLQTVSQLIRFIQNNQLSDLIFILGNNSYSLESRFYFNYRNIIDFYIKVIDFIETDNCFRIKYNIYKTKPISKNFFVNIYLFKEKENNSKLEIEIILINDPNINQKILNIIYNEFNYNFLYLSQAIKAIKQNSFSYNSNIIKQEFHILSQILQNVKLIEYIINWKLEKIINDEKEEYNSSKNNNNNNYININNDKFIHLNEIYKIIFNKKKEIKDWISVNNISFKIQSLKSREDRMILQLKILLNNKEDESNESNYLYNLISVQVRKLTSNTSFIFIKCVWNFNLTENLILEVKKLIKKCLNKIKKLCEISKDKYNF